MVQEQRLQLKMNFLLGYKYKLLFIRGLNIWLGVAGFSN